MQEADSVVIYPQQAEAQGGDRRSSPQTSWPAWSAALALVGGVVLAAVASFVVDLPALAFGVKITSSHTPPGLAILDTIVQDIAFVLAAVYCAQLGGRVVRSWQFGLRAPGRGWKNASAWIVALIASFFVVSIAWAALVKPEDEELLKQLGSNKNAALLLLSAALTCVIAPVAEEVLFRGYIFSALRNWRGTIPAALMTGILFGAVHVGSAPALDLVPLAALGFGLCLLYRHTGSLYPSIVAHVLNNSIAFSSLEHWGWQVPILIIGSLLGVGALALLFKSLGVITPTPLLARADN